MTLQQFLAANTVHAIEYTLQSAMSKYIYTYFSNATSSSSWPFVLKSTTLCENQKTVLQNSRSIFMEMAQEVVCTLDRRLAL